MALKFISKSNKNEKELRSLRQEIEILRKLHHENIIELLDSFETDKEVSILFKPTSINKKKKRIS